MVSSYKDIISRVLSVGYHVSIVIMVIGLMLYIGGTGAAAITVIKAGLLVLLATPLLRVIASALVFYFIERDKKYALVSTTVFLILVTSIVIGRAV